MQFTYTSDSDVINVGVRLLEAFGREAAASTYGITRYATPFTIAGIKQQAKSLRLQIEVAQAKGPLARAQEFQDRIGAVIAEALDATTMTSEEIKALDPLTFKADDYLVHPEIPVFAHMHLIR